MIAYEEEDALRRILRHHGVVFPDRGLITALSTFIEWIHQTEQAKGSFVRGSEPMPLLSLLSTLGIYGGEAINKVDKSDAGTAKTP